MKTHFNSISKIIFIFFLFISTSSFAQNFTVSGKILNKNNQPQNQVVVSIFTPENQLVKTAITNTDGVFEFKNMANATYQLKINSKNFNPIIQPDVVVLNANLVLNDIVLEDANNQIDAVLITKERPIISVQADKTVFNVENTINATGNNGLELLRKAPGVTLDNNDNVILEGKTGVQFYVDGKQFFLSGADLTNYLKSLNSNDIESFELITQPSAKYDAAGNAGIINIKLKKNKNFGTNGTISTGVNVGKWATSVNSISFNNRNKKINIYGNYSNRFGQSYNFIYLNRTQNNTNFDSKNESTFNNNANNLKLGVDFSKNAKNSFGLVFNGNFNNQFVNGITKTPITNLITNNIDQILVANSDTRSKNYNVSTNLNYRYTGANNTTFSADLDLGQYKNDNDLFLSNNLFNGNQTSLVAINATNNQITPIKINIFSFKTDYEQALLKGKFGVGFKSSVVNSNNNFNFFDVINNNNFLNTNESNLFQYQENVNALYVNFNRKFEKWSYQIGLRTENTQSDGDLTSFQINNNKRVTRSYTDFFPSGGISYNLNDNNSWAFNYSRRIERPNYQSLNPFRRQLDNLSFVQGNPFLQPQYTDNLKITHTYKYKLTTSLSYSYITDFSAQVTEIVDTQKSSITQKNVADNRIFNLSVSYPFAVNKWWNVFFSFNGTHSKYISRSSNFISLTQQNFNIYAQNNIKLPAKVNMEVSGWFSSPSVWGGTYQLKSLGSLDLAFQKKWMSEKLTARLAFSDILFTSPWNGRTDFPGLSIAGTGGQDSRQVRFSLAYNFGNSQVKKEQQRTTGAEEEKNRLNGN